MPSGVRTTVISCLVFVTLAFSFVIISRQQERLPDLDQLQAQGLTVLSRPREVMDFSLLDQHGQPFGRDDLKGHWSVMFFGFTNCPDICPTTLAQLAQADQQIDRSQLAAPISTYLVSVDPERDTAKKLREYTGYFSPEFFGITGTVAQLGEFASQVGIAFAKIPSDGVDGYTIDHSVQIIVFNPKGHFHAFMKPPHEAAQIALFLRALDDAFET